MTKKEAFIEQLSKLPEPYRTAAISQYDDEFSLTFPETIADALYHFADWGKTKENKQFWIDLHKHYFDLQGYSPTPYPAHLLPKVEEAEPKQEESEIKQFIKAYLIKEGQHEKRLEEIEKGLFALKEGFQQLEKELDQRCPKNCGFVPILTPEPNELERFILFLKRPLTEETKARLDKAYEEIKLANYEGPTAIDYVKNMELEKPSMLEFVQDYLANTSDEQKRKDMEELTKLNLGGPTLEEYTEFLKNTYNKPEPEPKAAKLPVTEDEVLKINKERPSFFLGAKGELREGIFRDDYFEEFRHESTAKKVRAFCILSKIAEAQNEMVEKGDSCFFVSFEEMEIQLKQRIVSTLNHKYGLIYFHSKQGLKDCIEANRDLWMDYLTN